MHRRFDWIASWTDGWTDGQTKRIIEMRKPHLKTKVYSGSGLKTKLFVFSFLIKSNILLNTKSLLYCSVAFSDYLSLNFDLLPSRLL